MAVKQISVFMENKPGRVYKLSRALGEAGIDLVALSIADTREYGIARLIARDNDKAYAVLKEAGFAVEQTELIGVETPDEPNGLAGVIKILEEKDVNIEYLYSFALSCDNSAKILLKVSDLAYAEKILSENGAKLLDETIL